MTRDRLAELLFELKSISRDLFVTWKGGYFAAWTGDDSISISQGNMTILLIPKFNDFRYLDEFTPTYKPLRNPVRAVKEIIDKVPDEQFKQMAEWVLEEVWDE